MDMTRAEMNRALEAGARLLAQKDPEGLREALLSCAMELTHCDEGSLYLLEDDCLRPRLQKSHARGPEDGVDLPPVPLRPEYFCARALLEERVLSVEDLRACPDYDFSQDIRRDLMREYRTQSLLAVPVGGRGVLLLANALDEAGAVRPFAPEAGPLLQALAAQAAVTMENLRQRAGREALLRSLVRVLATAIDKRSHYSADHTRRMARCGERFLDFLNARAAAAGEAPPFPPARREALLLCIWLHDVGKVATPLEVMDKAERLLPRQRDQIRHRMDRIRLQARLDCAQGKITEAEANRRDREAQETWDRLRKISLSGTVRDEQAAWLESLRSRTYENVLDGGVQSPWLREDEYAMLTIRRGTLSDEERQVMEEHAALTERLLSQIDFPPELREVPVWAAAHHELLDGSGYPRHRTADDIPREARIVTILDIFDALIADDRPYKPGLPADEALAVLQEMARAGQLDSDLVTLHAESRCWEI